MELYEFGYRKGRNRTIRVSAETGDVAKAAGELLLKAVQRKQSDRQAVKELTDAALRWRRHADSFRWKGPDGEAIRRFYIEKSQKAIDAAGRIIAEGER
jgi:hypothetical protein